MRASQVGDRVRVHYVKHYADGSVRSSRDGAGAPLEVVVGTTHPRLRWLGDELAGMRAGDSARVVVPADRAFGPADPARVLPVSRDRFAAGAALTPGGRARMRLSRGRVRVVRVVEVKGRRVVVDANHPRCGEAVEVEVQVVAVEAAGAAGHWGP